MTSNISGWAVTVTGGNEFTVRVGIATALGGGGAPGVGVPAGGTTGQLLSKASATDYDTAWTDPPTGTITPGPGFRLVGSELRYDIQSLTRA